MSDFIYSMNSQSFTTSQPLHQMVEDESSSTASWASSFHLPASTPPSAALDIKSTLSFPLKLRHMLQEAEDQDMAHIVSWEMEGTAFRVHLPDEFVAQIMRRWFNQTKYKSFQRQLNLYGFSRITRGPQKGCYLHPLFQRAKPDLANGIARKKITQEPDAEASLAPSWLSDTCSLLEPTPIQEAINKNNSITSSPNASATSQLAPMRAASEALAKSFEEYFQTNVNKEKPEADFPDLKKPGAVACTNALERMLDNIIPQGASSPVSVEDPSDGTKNGRGGASRPAIFPGKLHDMLDYCEGNGLEHVASWQMEGRAFKVHNIDLFMKHLMPKFFKLTKFESLQRQLNLYSFTRIARGKMKGCYHHPLFVKGGWTLSQSMQRRKPEEVVLPDFVKAEPSQADAAVVKSSAVSSAALILDEPDDLASCDSSTKPPLNASVLMPAMMMAGTNTSNGFGAFPPMNAVPQMNDNTAMGRLEFGFVPTIFN
eukprot:Nitzschia sp. Nitz4//scaffold185_size43419//24103//25634//NITZ4_007303-RA/size43419-augustus-gene-0.65-mRNA-1//1//CDS//3329539715//7155//frame0